MLFSYIKNTGIKPGDKVEITLNDGTKCKGRCIGEWTFIREKDGGWVYPRQMKQVVACEESPEPESAT